MDAKLNQGDNGNNPEVEQESDEDSEFQDACEHHSSQRQDAGNVPSSIRTANQNTSVVAYDPACMEGAIHPVLSPSHVGTIVQREVGSNPHKIMTHNTIQAKYEHNESLLNFGGASNSTITVKNLTVNQQTAPRDAPEQLTTGESKDFEKELIQAFMKNTEQKTRDRVTSTFDNLSMPSKQVNPELTVIDCYRGYRSLESPGYMPEAYMYQPNENEGRKINMSQILDDVEKFCALVGSAGSGKTTAAKRFAQMVIKKKIPNLEHIKLVHFVTIADLSSSKENTAYNLLFRKPLGSKFPKRISESYGAEWVEEHASEILIIFDGLDQATWKLENGMEKICYEDKETAPVIMHNILNNDCFPRFNILITSREHAIHDWTQDRRPDKTIALNGFSFNDQKYLVKELGGKHGEAIWNHLQYKSPSLLSLCTTPVFLVFTVAVWLHNIHDPPDTMTGILIKVLLYFLSSEHRRSTKHPDIFSKLKRLAYDGTIKRKVLFDREEITKLGLDCDSLSDLLGTTPSLCTPPNFRIMEGFSKMFFLHQTLQEALTALYVIDMDILDFETFVDQHLNDPRFFVIKYIMSGILLNSKINVGANKQVIGDISEPVVKASILLMRIRMALIESRPKLEPNVSVMHSDDTLCSLLHECGDGVDELIKQDLNIVHAQKMLAGANLFFITSTMCRCSEIDHVKLYILRPEERDMALLGRAVQVGKKIEICILKMNKFGSLLTADAFLHMGSVIQVSKLERLEINIYDFTQENISQFKQSCSQVEERAGIESLVITQELGNIAVEPENFHSLSEFLKIVKITSLKLNQCECREGHMKILCEGMTDFTGKITKLDLTAVTNLELDAFYRIGRIAQLAKIKNLVMAGCNVSGEKLGRFMSALTGHCSWQMHSLHLDGNPDMDAESYLQIGELVMRYNIQVLGLTSNNITVEKLRKLRESLSQYSGQIRELLLDWNGKMAPDAYFAIGELIKLNVVENLSLANCQLNKEKLLVLKDSLVHFTGQVKDLDVSWNKDMKFDVLCLIMEIARIVKLETLKVHCCTITMSWLPNLHEAFPDLENLLIDLQSGEDTKTLQQHVEDLKPILHFCAMRGIPPPDI